MSFLAQDLNESFTYMPDNCSHINRIALAYAQGNLHDYFDSLNENSAAAMVEAINRLRE
jgi:hypothetical protein